MSVGIDIVDISRIEKIDKEKFSGKILSDIELKNTYKTENLAGIFAAKEAFSKAMGTGLLGFGFKDISVMHNPQGKPYLDFSSKLEKIMEQKGVMSTELSISHEKGYAVAVVNLTIDNKSYLYEKAIKKLKDTPENAITPDIIKGILKKREKDIHKGDCGRLLIIAGSIGLTGAAIMSSVSSLRCGAGLITLVCPKSLNHIFEAAIPEVMTMPVDDTDGIINKNEIDKIIDKAKKSDCVLFGPGLGANDNISEILKELISNCKNIVIDADGINVLSKNIDILKEHKCNIVITPHIGEFSRLTNLETKEILKNTAEYAKEFAAKHNICVILKSHKTVVAMPDGKIYENHLGNPGMATGGTGDVLSGATASFFAQGYDIEKCSLLGVYIHSLAADMAAFVTGEYGLIPSDIISYIPFAIKNSIGEV